MLVFREGKGKRRPRRIDIQVKGESREVSMTELELEAQRERDTRQDAEMWGAQRENDASTNDSVDRM